MSAGEFYKDRLFGFVQCRGPFEGGFLFDRLHKCHDGGWARMSGALLLDSPTVTKRLERGDLLATKDPRDE